MVEKKSYKLDRLSRLDGMAYGIFITSFFWMVSAGRGDDNALYCLILGAVMGICTGFAAHMRAGSSEK